ncbi:myelin basic protein isoform X2 [Oncorhynchus tshawytscha]|uniref:Myelin basic protein n=3 Tax=Salmoninae TaxID=504568 RepID=A0A8C7GM40_ONCKI|nr:myelin basic protein isoform X2 [Oncorhynchus kisutch]XP_024297633.1 myelin basic protein isoform X2 [Oncorhynchus tshawytscha]XP_029587262.1 myelin basic protein-like isoform X2 [Salmo trutta]
MATASTSGQSSFGLSRRKKAPGLMDQISTFFGGDKNKRGKGSFRGHATSPKPAPRRRANENAVMHFFRSLSVTASPRPKSRASPPHADATKSSYRCRRDQGTLSKIFNLETKSRLPPKRWSTIF